MKMNFRGFVAELEKKGLKHYKVNKDAIMGDAYYYRWSKETEATINEVWDRYYKYFVKTIKVAYSDEDAIMVWESIF